VPYLVAGYLVVLVSGLCLLAPDRRERPAREVYACHVYECPACNGPTLDLCPAGEDLRRKARDADGLRDPVLDR